jgi:hypothetical protein
MTEYAKCPLIGSGKRSMSIACIFGAERAESGDKAFSKNEGNQKN